MSNARSLVATLLTVLLPSCVSARDASPTAALSPSQETLTTSPVSTTPTATGQGTPTLSEDEERRFIAATLVAGGSPQTRESNPSPDGEWIAEVIAYDCTPVKVLDEYFNALNILQIRDAQTAETRIIETQLQFCGGLGAAGLSAGLWSRNSKYLHFTDAASGIPEGCGWWIPPIKRLDVSTWSVEYLGSGPLSPDGEMRATWQGISLLISSIEQGNLTHVEPMFPHMILGQIAWSPANSALVYLQTELDCYPWGNTSLVHVDLSNFSSRLLLESNTPSFAWAEWKQPNRLYLRDQDDNQWTYDLLTDTLAESQ